MFGAFTYSKKGEYLWHFGNKKVFLKIDSPYSRIKDYSEFKFLYVFHNGEKKYVEDLFNAMDIDFEKLKKTYSPKEIVFGFANVIAEGFYEAIKQNTQLIKECNTNIYVTMDREDGNVAGSYEHESDSQNIFFNIFLNYEQVEAFINKKKLDKESQSYKTIIHELTHSYDKVLQQTKISNIKEFELASVAKILNTNLYSPENIFLCKQIDLLRTEGLASIAEGTLSQKSNYGILVSMRELFTTFGKEETLPNDMKILNYLVSATAYGLSLDRLTTEEKKYGERFHYTVGRFLCLIIALSKLSSSEKEIFLFGGTSKPQKNLMTVLIENGYENGKNIENTEEFRKSGFFRISIDYLKSILKRIQSGVYSGFKDIFSGTNMDDIWIFIPSKSVTHFEYILNFISRTNTSEFLLTYIKACGTLGLDAGSFDTINLQKLTRLAKEHRENIAKRYIKEF